MSYFELVGNVSESDVEYPVPPSLAKELGEIYTAILEGEPMVHQLKMLKRDYPGIPQIDNMLSLAYIEKEDFERAYSVNQEAYKEFPDYIFARVNITQEYLNKDELEKAAEIINPASAITEVFPNRKKLHTGEYTGFQKIRALYYAKADMPEEFLQVVEETEELLKDEIVLLQFRSYIMEVIDAYELEDYDIISEYAGFVKDELDEKYGLSDEDFDEDEEGEYDFEDDPMFSGIVDSNGYETKGYDEDIQTNEPPAFHYPEEIEPLYQYDFEIPAAAVETLLSLPEKELTEDLCEVLKDAMRRYEYYSDDENETIDPLFPWHAMNILRTIKAQTALPVMLNFLEQGEELNDFYMGDLNTEALWQMFYPFCSSGKNEMVSFLMQPKIYAFSKFPVLHAFTQFALHNEAHRTEVSGIFGQIISFFLEKKDGDDRPDPTFMDMLCDEVMDCGFAELKLLVKTVYDNDLHDGWYKDYKAWEEEFAFKRKEGDSQKPIMNWQQLNAEIEKTFRN